jgi:hypothetical protein
MIKELVQTCLSESGPKNRTDARKATYVSAIPSSGTNMLTQLRVPTGVRLGDYQRDRRQIRMHIQPQNKSYEVRYRIEFISRNGQVLQDTTGMQSTYVIKGDELYVRTRISDSSGRTAWTQPVFLKQ